MSDSIVVDVNDYALTIAKENGIDPDDVIITLSWNDLSDAILN